mmetsp:Transcript_11431/g.32448  ORF Transcript_11431/g.32448 Transcript_11431/m.32448 type:complete len:312 (-) Transcript_11431:495-1430(-)
MWAPCHGADALWVLQGAGESAIRAEDGAGLVVGGRGQQVGLCGVPLHAVGGGGVVFVALGKGALLHIEGVGAAGGGAGSHKFAVRRPCHAVQHPLGPNECLDGLLGGEVPQADSGVIGAGGKQVGIVGVEGTPKDGLCVAAARLPLYTPPLEVVQHHRAILDGEDNFGGAGDRVDRLQSGLAGLQALHGLRPGDVPQLHNTAAVTDGHKGPGHCLDKAYAAVSGGLLEETCSGCLLPALVHHIQLHVAIPVGGKQVVFRQGVEGQGGDAGLPWDVDALLGVQVVQVNRAIIVSHGNLGGLLWALAKRSDVL